MRILRAVASEAHTCGCLLGIYETYDGNIVRLIDAVGEHCRTHRQGERVDPTEVSAAEPPDFFAPHPSA